MITIDMINRYMNIMALGLQIVSGFPHVPTELYAIQNYEKIDKFVCNKMDVFWQEDLTDFLDQAESFVECLVGKKESGFKYASAHSLCIWMDSKITYLSSSENSRGKRQCFSLYSVLPKGSEKAAIVESLNTNYEDTGIWINPKFPVTSTYTMREGEKVERPVHNRDVFQGINETLENCNYVQYNGHNRIVNVIFPFPENLITRKKDEQIFRIAFAPMTDKKNLLQKEERVINHGVIEKKGVFFKPIAEAEELYERLKRDYKLAGDIEADIFYAPEMLGSELSERNDGVYNEMIYEIWEQRMLNEEPVPILAILPSYWEEGENCVTVVAEDGEIIEKHLKQSPYVDVKNHTIEGLKEVKEQKMIIYHIPYVHRISIMICSEFLEKEIKRVQEILCGELGVTLLVVLSYSPGEQDFINALSGLKVYGTTVVWGNCCGAGKNSERAIGGCDIAGINKTHIFSDRCECGFSCDNVEACVFQVDIPLEYRVLKSGEVEYGNVVTHILRKVAVA